MTFEEGLRLLFSFLGGGLVVGILDWVRANRSERRARALAAAADQIRNLYGPLYFFTSQNEQYFRLAGQLNKAYQIEYVEPTWSDHPATQTSLRQETETTIELGNEYIREVVKNNEQIVDILRDNYAYIEPADVEIFQQFNVDYKRLKIECDEASKLKTPFRVYQHLGDISFMRPEFIELVKRRFEEKKRSLNDE